LKLEVWGKVIEANIVAENLTSGSTILHFHKENKGIN
jgi:hypothetical protein